jgi:hypothetical protein
MAQEYLTPYNEKPATSTDLFQNGFVNDKTALDETNLNNVLAAIVQSDANVQNARKYINEQVELQSKEIEDVNKDIAELQKDISGLNTYKSTNETAMNNITTRITTAESKINGCVTTSTYTTDQNALSTYKQGVDQSLNTLNESVGNINTIINYLEDTNVVVTQPKFTLTLTNNKGTSAEESLKTSYEIGTNLTVSYSFNLDKGKYKYDADTGVTASSYKLTKNGSSVGTSQSGNLTAFQLDANSVRFSSSCNHSAGKVPQSNLQRDVNEKQIKQGAYLPAQINNTTATDWTITPFREGCFFGALTDKDRTIETLTSDDIRSLTTVEKNNKSNKAFPTNAETITFTVPAGTKTIVVACPKGTKSYETYGPTNALNSTVNAQMYDLFGLDNMAGNVDVKGANNSSSVPYNVWMYTPSYPYEKATKITLTLGYFSISS